VDGTDPEQIDLSPPLPGDALRARVTFMRARAGFGFKSAPRSEATHARIEETGPDGQTRERRVGVAEAAEYLSEVDGMQGIPAPSDPERAPQVRVDCPHCGIPRAYEGMAPQPAAYHQYACPRCGSIELFRAGGVEHPLPGAG
jgi:hypothetical protein